MKIRGKNGFSGEEIAKIVSSLSEVTPSNIADLAMQIKEPELDTTKRKLLAFKLLPHSFFATVKVKAEMVGVTERRIYQIEAESAFREACVRQIKINIGTFIPDVWHAFIANAKSGDTQAQLAILRETQIMSPPLEKREHSGEITTINVQKEAEKQCDNLKNRMGMGKKSKDIPYLENIELEGKK